MTTAQHIRMMFILLAIIEIGILIVGAWYSGWDGIVVLLTMLAIVVLNVFLTGITIVLYQRNRKNKKKKWED